MATPTQQLRPPPPAACGRSALAAALPTLAAALENLLLPLLPPPQPLRPPASDAHPAPLASAPPAIARHPSAGWPSSASASSLPFQTPSSLIHQSHPNHECTFPTPIDATGHSESSIYDRSTCQPCPRHHANTASGTESHPQQQQQQQPSIFQPTPTQAALNNQTIPHAIATHAFTNPSTNDTLQHMSLPPVAPQSKRKRPIDTDDNMDDSSANMPAVDRPDTDTHLGSDSNPSRIAPTPFHRSVKFMRVANHLTSRFACSMQIGDQSRRRGDDDDDVTDTHANNDRLMRESNVAQVAEALSPMHHHLVRHPSAASTGSTSDLVFPPAHLGGPKINATTNTARDEDDAMIDDTDDVVRAGNSLSMSTFGGHSRRDITTANPLTSISTSPSPSPPVLAESQNTSLWTDTHPNQETPPASLKPHLTRLSHMRGIPLADLWYQWRVKRRELESNVTMLTQGLPSDSYDDVRLILLNVLDAAAWLSGIENGHSPSVQEPSHANSGVNATESPEQITAQTAKNALAELHWLVPAWHLAQHRLSDIVHYVQTVEDVRTFVSSPSTVLSTYSASLGLDTSSLPVKPTSESSCYDQLARESDALVLFISSKRQSYGDVLRQAALPWRVLGFPVAEIDPLFAAFGDTLFQFVFGYLDRVERAVCGKVVPSFTGDAASASAWQDQHHSSHRGGDHELFGTGTTLQGHHQQPQITLSEAGRIQTAILRSMDVLAQATDLVGASAQIPRAMETLAMRLCITFCDLALMQVSYLVGQPHTATNNLSRSLTTPASRASGSTVKAKPVRMPDARLAFQSEMMMQLLQRMRVVASHSPHRLLPGPSLSSVLGASGSASSSDDPLAPSGSHVHLHHPSFRSKPGVGSSGQNAVQTDAAFGSGGESNVPPSPIRSNSLSSLSSISSSSSSLVHRNLAMPHQGMGQAPILGVSLTASTEPLPPRTLQQPSTTAAGWHHASVSSSSFHDHQPQYRHRLNSLTSLYAHATHSSADLTQMDDTANMHHASTVQPHNTVPACQPPDDRLASLLVECGLAICAHAARPRQNTSVVLSTATSPATDNHTHTTAINTHRLSASDIFHGTNSTSNLFTTTSVSTSSVSSASTTVPVTGHLMTRIACQLVHAMFQLVEHELDSSEIDRIQRLVESVAPDMDM